MKMREIVKTPFHIPKKFKKMFHRKEILMTDSSVKLSTMERWVSIMSEFIKKEEYRRKQRKEAGYDITCYFHSLAKTDDVERDPVPDIDSEVHT